MVLTTGIEMTMLDIKSHPLTKNAQFAHDSSAEVALLQNEIVCKN